MILWLQSNNKLIIHHTRVYWEQSVKMDLCVLLCYAWRALVTSYSVFIYIISFATEVRSVTVSYLFWHSSLD